MPMRRGWKLLADEFVNNGTLIEFHRDEIVIRPEITPPGVFFVDKGHFKVYELTRSGNENIHTFKQPGNIFPMRWAIINQQRESYTQAISDATVYRLAASHFRDFLRNQPDVMIDTLKSMVMLYESYSERIHNLEYRYAKERIAFRLLALARRYGVLHKGKYYIHLPIRQSEFADSINVTRETASRELGKLKRNGIIDYNDTEYLILKPKALEKLF
ncbi:MAG: Crp/Fnr family transcriptional regulator [Candidatus Saccharimonadales bacterium]|nr:Crp/Fnr family transcriptional regulator [Candidatus Saccharimonadales bacterium]